MNHEESDQNARMIVASVLADGDGEPRVGRFERTIAGVIVEKLREAGLLGVVSDTPGPEVVVICGSTRFRSEIAHANRDLTLEGAIVLAPGVFGHSGDAMTDEQKEALDVLHFRKIDMADRVVVVAPGGYIGESTSREIAYAKERGVSVEVREVFEAAVSDTTPSDHECGMHCEGFETGVTPTPSEPTAKVVPVSHEASASCSHGVCPAGCSHLMWECKACSCEGGWGAPRERLEELASQHACVAVASTPSEGEREALIHECVQFVDEAAFDAPQDYPLGYETAAQTVRSIIEAVTARGFRLTPPAPVDRETVEKMQDELEYRVRTTIALWKARQRAQGVKYANLVVDGEVQAGRARIAALAGSPATVDRTKLIAHFREQTKICEPVASQIAEHHADALLAAFPALAVSPAPARPSPGDREHLALMRVWRAIGNAGNPDDFKTSVRDAMWDQLVESLEQYAAQGTRLHRENEQLRAELSGRPAAARDEWEYAWKADEERRVMMTPRGPRLLIDGHPHTPEEIARFPRGQRVRRRKAGPWLPVTEEERRG